MNRTPLTEARRQIIEVAQALDAAGLMLNKSGNVSCRCDAEFLITPAAIPYGELRPDQVVSLRLDAEPLAGEVRPSSEWRMHAAIYRARPDASAVVHTHSPCATALACAGEGIPPFHYMIALAGGDVRCAPYATFGSEALAEAAVAGLAGRRATLLANHGVIAIGPSLRVAQAVALEVENLASQYLGLRAAGLAPQLLEAAELDRVLAKFADYGRLG